MRRVTALGLAAMLPLAGCGSLLGNRCTSAGQPGSAAYQSCMQAEYAREMQEMDYKAWLDLTKDKGTG
jgi:hypothetical protein